MQRLYLVLTACLCYALCAKIPSGDIPLQELVKEHPELAKRLMDHAMKNPEIVTKIMNTTTEDLEEVLEDAVENHQLPEDIAEMLRALDEEQKQQSNHDQTVTDTIIEPGARTEKVSPPPTAVADTPKEHQKTVDAPHDRSPPVVEKAPPVTVVSPPTPSSKTQVAKEPAKVESPSAPISKPETPVKSDRKSGGTPYVPPAPSNMSPRKIPEKISLRRQPGNPTDIPESIRDRQKKFYHSSSSTFYISILSLSIML